MKQTNSLRMLWLGIWLVVTGLLLVSLQPWPRQK
jgi:hypothetical protein